MSARVAALLLAVALLLDGRAALAAPSCRLQDPAITESSGLAAGPERRWLLTHNDSGDLARFFVVRTTDCVTLATHTLTDRSGVPVKPRDVEAMAIGPRGSVWLADIGDNDAERDDIALYRVPHRSVDVRRTSAEVARTRWVRYPLAYEDGPHDAEAVLVHPGSGRVHVVTKDWLGGAGIYIAPARLVADGTNLLRRVATVDLPAALSLPAVTDGALSQSGRRLVLRTYTHAYVWEVGRGGVAAAVRRRAKRVALPEQQQGESVAWLDERTLVVTSEGQNPVVHQVRVGPAG